MGCGYMNGQRRLFGMVLLRKADEVSKGVNIVWKIELGESLTDKEKTNLVGLLTQPGLEKKLRDEFNWLQFEDPKPSSVVPERLFSGRYSRKELKEAKVYLNALINYYMAASENYK